VEILYFDEGKVTFISYLETAYAFWCELALDSGSFGCTLVFDLVEPTLGVGIKKLNSSTVE